MDDIMKAVRAGSKSKSFGVTNFSELTSEERTRYGSCLMYSLAPVYISFINFEKVINPFIHCNATIMGQNLREEIYFYMPKNGQIYSE